MDWGDENACNLNGMTQDGSNRYEYIVFTVIEWHDLFGIINK